MTIHTRMKLRTEREKDLLKYGRKQERERIIKLLEDFYDGNLWRQTGATSYVGFDIVELIELIKGEQK